MHILLTDILTCPRCGPEFGLIVRADRLEERRIREGAFGCGNCRESFPVAGGIGDLRYPHSGPIATAGGWELRGEEAADKALQMAALMGVREGPGMVLILGPGAVLAGAVSALIAEIEVVAADASVAGQPESPGVSRVLHGTRLPFRNWSMRGVVITGEPEPEVLAEAVRTLKPGARLVVDSAREASSETAAELGLTILLEEAGVMVASSSGRG
ncbi:MAG TPA: hypothetical protein VFI91_01335 [Longimicrobiaceae bacterium]|nr:hypothetical protein [Longimicrobiaceae bacterium]